MKDAFAILGATLIALVPLSAVIAAVAAWVTHVSYRIWQGLPRGG
jgi:pheromone shutdown protein TraB